MDISLPSRTRFAFLVHPRIDVAADLATVHPLLGLMPSRTLETGMRRLPLRPWVHARVTAADRPVEPFGEVVLVPLSPAMLLGPDRALVQRRIDQAVDGAVDRGADLVGLGALTAPVTAGGGKLRRRTDVGVTNGNAFTAAMTVRAVLRLAAAMSSRPVIALVGANGSVGTAVARSLARTDAAADLLLIGRTASSLAALAGDVGAQWSTHVADCRRADLVVLMTSAADAVLMPEHLKLGAIVVDDTQPRNTSPRLARERPDVLILDGGLVETPGLKRSGFNIGLPDHLSFACLAETALLALDGHRGHGTIGRPSVEQVERMLALADRYAHLGFSLAPPTSFGRPVTAAGWHTPSRHETIGRLTDLADGAVA